MGLERTASDKWVEKLYPGVTDGFYIEVGAATGLSQSASYYFEKIGWSGKSVEANPHFHAEFVANRKNPCIKAALTSEDGTTEFIISQNQYYSCVKRNISPWHEIKVYNDGFQVVESPTISFRTLLADCPKFIHAIFMDIEGSELECLKSFPFAEYKVGCFVIEISDNAIIDLMNVHSYAKVDNEFSNAEWDGHFVPR